MVLQNSQNNRIVDGLVVGLLNSATGDIWYRDANGLFTRLPIGTSGQVLTTGGSGLPVWATGAVPSGNAGGVLSGTYPSPGLANSAVAFANMQNIATARILGRNSAGSGVIEELTPANARTAMGLGTASQANTGTAAGNVPVLDSSGLLDTAVLPPLSLTSVQVVANQAARLALSNVQIGDAAKQTDNGIAYILSALPASTDANWISIGDSVITASDIISGVIATARLGTGTADATTYLRGDQTWQPLPVVPLPNVFVAAASQALAGNTVYLMNFTSLVTGTLPASGIQGSLIRIIGTGGTGWRVAQNANQQIYFGNQSTTVGITGRLDSTHPRDSVDLYCVSGGPSTVWQVVSSIGNIDVV